MVEKLLDEALRSFLPYIRNVYNSRTISTIHGRFLRFADSFGFIFTIHGQGDFFQKILQFEDNFAHELYKIRNNVGWSDKVIFIFIKCLRIVLFLNQFQEVTDNVQFMDIHDI